MSDTLKMNTNAAVEALSDIYRQTHDRVMATLGETVASDDAALVVDIARRALAEAYLAALTTALHAVGASVAKELLPRSAEEELAIAERVRAETAATHQDEVDSLNLQRFFADEQRRVAEELRQEAEERRRDELHREELRKIRGY